MKRLGVFVTHPIQYQAPIWKKLAKVSNLDIKVHFLSDHSVRGGIDPGFGRAVKWDLPLLEGYPYEFLRKDCDIQRPMSFFIPRLREYLTAEKFDWVLCSGYTMPFEWQLLRYAPALGMKILMRGEFTDLKQRTPLLKTMIRTQVLRNVYRRVDAFGCIGKQAELHLLKHGVAPSRIFFSPYCVDDELFSQQRQVLDRSVCRKEIGIQDDTFVFLFSGKLIPRKGVMCLVRAFAHLPKHKKVALLLLGDGEQREEVLAEGRKILGERLMFQGFVNQSELGRYFMASDAFVLPSVYEAWGLVANEAMLFGLPLVLSDMIGCHLDLLLPGKTGYLFQTGNEQDLAKAMLRLVDAPEQAKEMGAFCQTWIEQYSVAQAAKGLEQAIFQTA